MDQTKADLLQYAAQQLGEILVEKNKSYGDATAKCAEIFRVLYPDGIRPEQYGDALLMVRITDKLQRIAHNKQAFNEDPYFDIAGYGILGFANTPPKTCEHCDFFRRAPNLSDNGMCIISTPSQSTGINETCDYYTRSHKTE